MHEPLAEPSSPILIVDDESSVRELLARALSGRVLRCAATAEEARAAVTGASAVLLDLKLGPVSGIELLREIVALDPTISVIVMTAHASIGTAVEAMKEGAFHYIAKPFASLEELRLLVDRAAQETELRRENFRLKGLLAQQDRFEEMIGGSEPMLALYRLIERIAEGDSTVLITGESGTGKELVARALHRRSPRAKAPFVEINCAAIPMTLLESELFGYEKGAFTGAIRAKKGLFESAHRGTIFLDEIGDMPVELQAKLLRVLDDRRFIRLGGSRPTEVDVRVVSATNRNLTEAVKRGVFREDLYYRLAVIEVAVPPLRKREGDVRRILTALLPNIPLDRGVLERLEAYAWPGNIRELRNFVERCVGLGLTKVSHEDLIEEFGRRKSDPSSTGSLPDRVDAFERRAIEEALKEAEGSRSEAARILGVSRQSLQYKLEKYGL